MPKVYTSQADRQEQRIVRYLQGAAAGKHEELAKLWGITKQGVGKRLKTGNVTPLDLWKARNLMKLDAKDITFLIGGE